MLVDTGIRAQELCDLVVMDYENKLGRLQIRHGKGNKSRMVFMGEAARKSLWRYLADRGDLRATEPDLCDTQRHSNGHGGTAQDD